MGIEDSIYTFLTGDTSISAVLATDTLGPAVWQDQPKEGALFPRIVYSKTQGRDNYHSHGACAIRDATIEIECQARTQAEAGRLRDEVREAITGFQGRMGEHWVSHAMITGDENQPYPAVHGMEQGVKAKLLTIEMVYQEMPK